MKRKRGCGCLTFIIIAIILILGTSWLLNNKDRLLEYFYPRDYEATISTYCDQYGVDKWLVLALIREESGFDTQAESGAGAQGIMQLMPDTAAWLVAKGGFAMDASDALAVPEDNIRLGVYYLSVLDANFQDENGNTDMATVIAAYNAGIGSVDEWLANGEWDGSTANLEDIPYAETRTHVANVLRSYSVYKKLYSGE